jgi:hypothetical protein
MRLIVAFCLLLNGLVLADTFVVNTGRDSHDADPGDGAAADEFYPDSSSCSLRASIEEANALSGRDTVLIPLSLSPIYLDLGSLILEGNGTAILGLEGRPVLDGVDNPTNHATFVVSADSCVIAGLEIQRSRGPAIDVFSSANTLGGSDSGAGLVLIGNNLDDLSGSCLRISGEGARNNKLQGSYVGMTADGITPRSNPNGVLLDHHAADNSIGGTAAASRNIISGNTGWGVIITGGAYANEVTGNYIGPDSTGYSGPGNGAGGVVLRSHATINRIGTNDIAWGNVISANGGNGVELSGNDVYNNIVDGNLVGSTASGELALPNFGEGVLVTAGAHNNTVGTAGPNSGNLISGNAYSGIHLSGNGVTRNTIAANWIGIGLDGYSGMGNCLLGGAGLFIDSGASVNTIGGSAETARNVISGNEGFGVHIDGAGTADNIVQGNYIGLNAGGTSSLDNIVGVAISGSSRSNIVGGSSRAEGNVISGNRSGEFPYGAGVLIYGSGTNYNEVMANIIGLDKDGKMARRNGSCGVIIGGGAQYNFVGGTTPDNGNVISGNGVDAPVDGRAAGVHIFGASTSWNRVAANIIGLDKNIDKTIGNRGHGIGIFSGAHHNTIGGDLMSQGNYIFGSEGAGICVSGPETRNNLIRSNLMMDNAGLGIDLQDSAQQGIYPPIFTQVGRLIVDGPRLVTGRDAPPGARIDVYQVASVDPSDSGEGFLLAGYTYAGSNGRFDFYLPSGPGIPIVLTAVATDAEGNSSEFSLNGYSPDAVDVLDDEELRPEDFALSQNFPNPFNATTRVVFSLPRKEQVTVTIHNVLGQQIRTLADGLFPAGEYELVWDGTDRHGNEVASGVYFYRLSSESGSLTRKMVMLK